jgi:hypothetical protein
MYPSSNLPYLPSALSTLLTIFLLLVISVGLLLEAIYSWEDQPRASSGPVTEERAKREERVKSKLSTKQKLKHPTNSSISEALITSTETEDDPSSPSPHSTFPSTSMSLFLLTVKKTIPIALPILLIVSNLILIFATLIIQWTFHGSSSLWLIYFCYVTLRWLVFIYLIWFNVLYIKALLILIKTLPLFALMISLLLLFIFIMGTLGRYLFIDQDIPGNNPYFGNMADSLWTILVALSSSSYPNQLVPSYTDNRTNMIYFFLLITTGSFIFLKLQFAAIFASFESNRQLFELKSSLLRIALLDTAFSAMDSVEQRGYLTYPQVNEVLEELYSYYSGFRKSGVPTSRERSLLLKAMDRDGNGRVYQEEFMMILDLTRISVNEEVGDLLSIPLAFTLSTINLSRSPCLLRSKVTS